MSAAPADRVSAIRAFNRFYTRHIGALAEGLLRTDHPLPEARVLFELGQRDVTDVGDLRRTLDLDAGYLSRLLARLEDRGLVTRERADDDARRQRVRLTAAGADAFALLDRRSADEIGGLLAGLGEERQRALLGAMDTVQDLLGDGARPRGFVVRAPRPGDLGWIVHRHGALYAQEYGWDERFEALVARIVADYAEDHDARREAAWIAEHGGAPAGCVLCVARSATVAQLRLLLVEPQARGLGIGAKLIDECLSFARHAGYAEIRLWTNDVLHAARRLYERAGFALVRSQPHHSFGHDLVEQDWSRML
jgi:DNA-binding MarR family transcriptional regulator/GNAT superfamily N-acetyltransferase